MEQTSASVKAANKKFFETTAAQYEAQDPRRRGSQLWLEKIFQNLAYELRHRFPEEKLVVADAGSGTGYVLRICEPYFDRRIAIDLSPAMLARIDDPKVEKITGELEDIPLQDKSVHLVTAFATLHHLYEPATFFAQAYRVLKSGGVLYTDHDIETSFVKRFAIILKHYRKAFDHWNQFIQNHPTLSQNDYLLSEYHGDNGLSGQKLAQVLNQLGFVHVEVTYHWQGMGFWEKIGSWFLGSKVGYAPILRIIAKKA